MPTRIVLRGDEIPSVRTSSRSRNIEDHDVFTTARIGSPQLHDGSGGGSGSARHRDSHRSIRFRSSILRKIKEDGPGRDELGVDIRSSPRIIGYLYTFTSSAVLLASVIQFYKERDSAQIIGQFRNLEEEEIDDQFVQAFGSRVLSWKLDASLAFSSIGLTSSMIVLLAHFDTFAFPKFWKKVFQDGSLRERNLLLSLLVFWAAAVWCCTSSFSVGEVQANVYFTTWIAFASTILNYDIWRASADLRTFDDYMESFVRETSRNWIVCTMFSFITSLAALEFYINRDNLDLQEQYGGFAESLFKRNEWLVGLSVSWGSFALCLIVQAINFYLGLNCTHKVNLCLGLVVTLDWRQLEGFLAAGLAGLYGWLVTEYTGVTGIFNSPSNPYFGIWGTFFAAIFTFGTWVRENKHFFFILRREQGGKSEEQAPEISSRPPPVDTSNPGED